MRKIIRTCIGCRGKFPQKTLIRFVCQNQQTLRVDNHKKLHGRGAYVCPKLYCIHKTFKVPKRINALLRVQLTNQVIAQFEKVLLEWTERPGSSTTT